jgi:hypothetical protein
LDAEGSIEVHVDVIAMDSHAWLVLGHAMRVLHPALITIKFTIEARAVHALGDSEEENGDTYAAHCT